MALDKFIRQAKKLASDPRVREKLNSERGRQVGGSVLNKAAGAANRATGGKYQGKIEQARRAADRAFNKDDGQGGYGDNRNGGPRP